MDRLQSLMERLSAQGPLSRQKRVSWFALASSRSSLNAFIIRRSGNMTGITDRSREPPSAMVRSVGVRAFSFGSGVKVSVSVQYMLICLDRAIASFWSFPKRILAFYGPFLDSGAA